MKTLTTAGVSCEKSFDPLAPVVARADDRAPPLSQAAVSQALQGMSRAISRLIRHSLQLGPDTAVAQKP
jgi:hypothetical protein